MGLAGAHRYTATDPAHTDNGEPRAHGTNKLMRADTEAALTRGPDPHPNPVSSTGELQSSHDPRGGLLEQSVEKLHHPH